MPNPTILSLAILKVNWDEPDSKDYLENFVPLVGECIRLSADDVISIPNLQKDLSSRFGLVIPQNALRSILKRLKKHQYIRQENTILYPIRDQLELLNFSETQQKVLSMEESLVRNLQSFVYEKFGLNWSQEEAEATLLGYLEENQLIVFKAIKGESQVKIPDEKKIKGRYIVGSFIRSLQESNSSDFEAIDILVKGSMLANAVYLPDPGRFSKKFAKTEVFFDTSFIIYALGYAGNPRQAPCVELLEMLYEVGGNLRCFQHTVEEIYGILDACASQLKRGSLKDAHGPSMEYFIEKGFLASDVELAMSRLNEDIKSLRIQIANKPEYEKLFMIDESGLQKKLDAGINYSNPKALQRDVDSISAIMRIRRGQRCYTFEDCRALFVTLNRDLVRFSKDFIHESASAGELPPAITDYDLTTLLWLKRPMEAPDLPRKRIIADCYAATKPNERLWKKYMDEVDKLEERGDCTPDDIYALRFSLEAKRALMELTYGEEAFFTEGTIKEILQMAREHIQHEVKEKLEEETVLRKQAEETLATNLAGEEHRQRKLAVNAQRWASKAIKAFEYFIMGILAFALLYTFPWNISNSKLGGFRFFVSTSLAVFFIYTLYNLWKGEPLTMIRSLEVDLTHWIEKRFRKLAGFEEKANSGPADLK